jgi:hypothetical protein
VNIIYRTGTNCTTYLKNRPHTFIAIHYVASVTSKKGTALNVAAWFNNPQNRNGSADWIVDDVDTVCYNNDPNRYCWAVGDDSRRYSNGGRLYGLARNKNTVSIEICNGSRSGKVVQANNPDLYFTDAAVQNALELAAYLMKRYNIPIENVVRHYDISGKYCPGVIGWNTNSGSDAAWVKFKARLKQMVEPESEEDMTDERVREIVHEILDGTNTKPSEWAEGEVAAATALGITDGSRPQGYLKREEAFALFVRFNAKTVSKTVADAVKAVLDKIRGVL